MNPEPNRTPLLSSLRVPLLFGLLGALLSACGGGESDNSTNAGIIDYAIAYVQRPIPVDENGDPVQIDLTDPTTFTPGGDLYVRDRAAPSSSDTNVTRSVTGGLGDVRDVESSYDGTKLIFSLREPDPDPDDDMEPTWNIWEYDLETRKLRQMTFDSPGNMHNDLGPYYLADGRIIFSSSRQPETAAVQLDVSYGIGPFAPIIVGQRSPALVLHILDPFDLANIKQLTFSQTNDLNPMVLASGEILFNRMDQATGNFTFYKMNPDGTNLQQVYGSHDPGASTGTSNEDVQVQIYSPRETSDGRIMALTMPQSGDYIVGGDITMIDIDNFIDNYQPVAGSSLSGPAQTSATPQTIYNDGSISPGGRFSAVYPLNDGTGRFLVSWSQCLLEQADGSILPCLGQDLTAEGVQEAPPRYGIWMYDPNDGVQQIVVKPSAGVVFTEVVALQPRALPTYISDNPLNPDWAAEGVGVLQIRSVYDFGAPIAGDVCFRSNCATGISSIPALADPAQATADQRPARFIRISKNVYLPDRNDPNLVDPPNIANTAFGRGGRNRGMREIIGYAPIDPDGSVSVKVPANIPLSISVLDRDGKRIGARHMNAIQVRPGELVQCNGCHAHPTGANATAPLPHGRNDAQAASINPGAPSPGTFANTLATYSITAETGDSMAQSKIKVDPALLTPTIDLVYEDIWTDPATAGRPADTAFRYDYLGADGLTTPPPLIVDTFCYPDWDSRCRIVINYQEHISPLWLLDRPDMDADGVDETCIACHSPTDAAGLARVPAAQLDLTDSVSDQEADHITSYRELLFGDNGQELDAGGNLVDILITRQARDPDTNELLFDLDGNPIMETVPDPAARVGPSMSVNGARASARFLSRFEAGGSHAGRLTPAELRLITEWLDIGAQYFNNPFDPAAPVN